MATETKELKTVLMEEQREDDIAMLTRKELKKLSRAELLELLVYQTKQVDKLRTMLSRANAKLEEREINLSQSGSLAEAALRINRIFESADLAARMYLENIRSSYQ